MKHSYLFASVAVIALGGVIAGCTDQKSQPSVSVEAGEATASSISFTITPANASKCAYVVLEEGETVPSADEILTNGTAADASSATEVTEEGLNASTSYSVVAAVSGEKGATATASASIKTAEEPAGIIFDPTRGTARVYKGMNVGLTLRTLLDGIDYELVLDIYDKNVEEKGYLGEGVFEISDGMADGDINREYSRVQLDNDVYTFKSGTLRVKIVDNTYNLRLAVILNNDTEFIATYIGTFEDMPIK